jgi:hypothetical protein
MMIALLFVWLFLITPSVSAGENVQLDEIVVTATRMDESLGETTSSGIRLYISDRQGISFMAFRGISVRLHA